MTRNRSHSPSALNLRDILHLLLLTSLVWGTPVHHAAGLSLEQTPAPRLASPNGRVVVEFDLHDFPHAPSAPGYSVQFDGRTVIAPSRLGLELERADFAEAMRVVGTTRRTADTTWQPVAGERSVVRNHYNELTVHLAKDSNVERRLNLVFRVYDQGAAFCLQIPSQVGLAEARVQREHCEFRFTADHVAWATYSAQGLYSETPLSGIRPGCERPLVIRVDDSTYVALAEARLVDYARMKLAPLQSAAHALITQLASTVTSPVPLTTPWRVIVLGNSPGQLLEHNDILLNLNDPCALKDTSWIRPGKVIREVTLTTTGGKACVDFAAQHGLQYVEFDAGWYGHEYDDHADATAVNVDPKRSAGPLDLSEIIHYANERDIGVLVYVNRRALEKQLDTLLPLYRSWGIRGVKYGFVNVGSQEWTRWLHDAIRKAAEHRLMVDVHDEYRGTGFSRTYPNLMTMEGIRGDEASPPVSQTLTIAFTRMLAGRADNTVCYMNERVNRLWSHSLQLAKPVCLFSPWQFLFWYDRPDAIGNPPELEFFAALPTTWDDTRVLQGEIGRHTVIARRAGSDWFVGIMNADVPRSFSIKFDFLQSQTAYHARVYTHDPEVERPTNVRVQQRPIRSDNTLTLDVAANNGAALWLSPVR